MEPEEKPNESETGARAACPLFADKQTNALFKVNLNYQESRVFASRQTAGRLRLQSQTRLDFLPVPFNREWLLHRINLKESEYLLWLSVERSRKLTNWMFAGSLSQLALQSKICSILR